MTKSGREPKFILRGQTMKFEKDYIISWDISDKDCPTISVAKLDAEKNSLKVDVLGISHEQSGVVSLRQLLDKKEIERKFEE